MFFGEPMLARYSLRPVKSMVEPAAGYVLACVRSSSFALCTWKRKACWR